jgi:hypothetical protein
MSSYIFIGLSSTRCVHFEYRPLFAEDQELLDEYVAKGGTLCIVDYNKISSEEGLFAYISKYLRFSEGEICTESIAEMADSLITLSQYCSALAIVVKNAGRGFTMLDASLFNLITAQLIQLHHWLDQNKPCNIIFHVDDSTLVI